MVGLSLQKKFLFLLAATSLVSTAATLTWVGPSQPRSDVPIPCAPDADCIIGSVPIFKVFGAQLSQPTAGDPNWTLKIQTNYGVPIPGNPDVVPAYLDSEIGSLTPGAAFSMGDFMIRWNNAFYAIVMHPHDGYQAGSLYKSSSSVAEFSYLTSGQVLGAGGAINIPNAPHYVKLAPGAALAGAGTLSGSSLGGDGKSAPKYEIVAKFSAPGNFLSSGQFMIDFSSYDCANGVLMGYGDFATSGGGGDVPEPGTLALFIPALALLGFGVIRKRGSR